MDKARIEQAVEAAVAGSDLFAVEIKLSAANAIEVVLDSDTRMDVDRCAAVSRALEQQLDREEEDFELTVASAGLGQPLKLPRQYRRRIGSELEVVLRDGEACTGVLEAAGEEGITVRSAEKVPVEGKKRKQTVERVRTIPFGEIRTAREKVRFR